jgi:serine/threonine protein kinase/tetratricopeptide (TPR) repeat protein
VLNNRILDEKTIFLQAIEIDSAEARSSYLDQACGDDQHLRGQLDALLGAHQRPPRLLVVTDLSLPSRDEAPTEERPGSTIGPYTLLEQIGEGGMGAVYLADQTQPVRRKVALKIIKPGMDSKQVVARFETERQALAMMDHPNIAKVFDGGTTDSGRPYFVMELVGGVPITEYCDREQLSIHQRLELFVLVCRAMQHAHQKGIIHRDLKPSNVMVSLHDGVAVPKVIDFGIAKATDQSLTEHTLLTGVMQLVGTPLYMSPEQAGMPGIDIDTRSDIYSLGVLLYELLTGSTPFDGETFRKAAIGELQRIIREVDPPTPSTRLSELGATLSTVSSNRQADARKLAHSVRGELDWIVMKALEKDRTRRYETANDFAADVMRHLTDQPVEACPPSRLYHLQKFVRRHRSRIAALGLIGVLGLALAVAVGWQSVERAARRAETASAVTQALDAAERSMRLTKWPDAMAAVSQVEALLGPGGGNDVLRQRSRRLRDDLTMVLRLDEIRQEMSAVKDDHFDTGLADRLYGEAFRDYGIEVESLEPDAVASKMPAGSVREELVAALDDGMRIRRGMHKKDDRDWKRLLAAARAADPDPWRNRVREAWARGDRKALRDLASSAPLDRLHPCDVLLLEGNLDPDPAVVLLREAQQRRPGDFWLNHTLGMRLHGMHPPRNDESLGYLRAASALRPESPGAILNVGHVLKHADRTDEAIAAYEQAIRLKPDYAMAYSNLGGALSDAGRFDEAISACRTAIRLNHNSSAAHGNLGRALTQIGELDEAIAALRVAMRLEPGGSRAAWHLADACYRKVVAGLQFIHKLIDEHIVRLRNQRHFLPSLLDPRSPPMLRRHFVLNLLVTSVLASPALAQKPPRYAYTGFDAAPGATYTRGGDINHAATIVGYFSDNSTPPHGYIFSGGAFTQYDVPGSASTQVQGINDAGSMVGRYDFPLVGLGYSHGFILSGGSLTTFDVPGSTSTGAKGINLAGDVVGRSIDAAGVGHGFLLRGGQFTSIDYPGATSTQCWKINNNGQIVGDYQDAAGSTHGYLLSGGQFTAVNYPRATYTQAIGLNAAGQVVGRYQLADGVWHGFLLSNGTYTTINYPNANGTEVYGINDFGELVGQWYNAAGTHGFYAVTQ